ncbi:ABC transporter permease [Streptomyces lavendulae]|uniref:Dipeptide transport system permease protein DppB n=1 Tax=Streptomyces lavendulae subsp. lavendulae TaxID=58340 RepID=A0A2K8PAX1_STRLA|nr:MULTISPECIES: ABC transporter permease [Streptomyces]GLX40132.1 ABC transporter permease [Streptomyces roseochromogenus]ATZ23887.1 Dipeptide transport system permease protein DppB [Streptomyces lavendulae subsp. lavendulae]MDH6538365.1 peptide/nickel transport system permease protein [Streptomyces sp. SPB4]QUQ53718.1 Dipeptide transport system permease protein DppB [Streptomyces lavendulae subsp. lavendulae]GLV86713.1 ABC transporter permease [Streptomyces lavendulae subsp. lavendulae]
MILYLVRRLLALAGVLLAIAAVTFLIFYVLPTDPAAAACGKTCSAERLADVRQYLGLDKPVWEQFADFLTGIFTGRTLGTGQFAVHCDFPCLGYSYENSLPVWNLLMDRLPVSASLAVGAAVLWLLLGLGAGVTAALRKDTATDKALMVGAVAAASLPVYFTSVMLIYGVIRVAGLLPYPSYQALTDDPLAWASNLLLPWTALALLYAAMYARQSRGSMIEAMAEPYIRTARAKGMPERTVVVKHGLRSGMTPILTIFGIDLGGLLAGAVITESIFGLPGIGRLFYGALVSSDQPVVLGVTLLAAFFIVVANLVVDLLYAVVDPRVRY